MPNPAWKVDALSALLALGRPVVMGILNVTPDSFSDGGRFDEPERALAQARQMIEAGADVIDIGAESSRPYVGATPVTSADELDRLRPVLAGVVALGTPVSIDTMKADVAEYALGEGAQIVNDVWGLQRDPDMALIVAKHDAPVIVMHNRETVDARIDIVADMIAFFARSLDIASQARIAPERIVLDPGIGFGKTPEQSMIALNRLDALHGFGRPILVGASRKRFIASVVASEPMQRVGGSIAAHLLAVDDGAAIVRVHDVAETVQALRVAQAIRSSL